jgi:nucleotide-binding universal stress UspA family protein
MKLKSVAHKRNSDAPLAEEHLPTASETGAGEAGLRALLAVEAGNPSFEVAEFLKRMLPAGSRVRVLTVRSYDFQGDGPWGSLGPPLPAPRDTEAEDHQITLRILESVGARVSARQRFGYPPDEILAEASDWAADFILVGHHNGLGRWFVGSVADHLLKRSVVPVLVVPQLSSVPTPDRQSVRETA